MALKIAKKKKYEVIVGNDICLNYLNLYKNDRQSVYHIQSFDDLKNTIILLRQEQNLSQRKLAEQAGCGHITIANFERNKNTITIDVFLKIIDVLGYQLKIEQL